MIQRDLDDFYIGVIQPCTVVRIHPDVWQELGRGHGWYLAQTTTQGNPRFKEWHMPGAVVQTITGLGKSRSLSDHRLEAAFDETITGLQPVHGFRDVADDDEDFAFGHAGFTMKRY